MTNSYGTHAAPPQPAGRSAQHGGYDTARPKTLAATVWASALAALLAFGGAAITFAAGKSMLRSELKGTALGGSNDLVSAVVDVAYKTLQNRAIIAVVVAIILAVFVFLVRSGRTGIRIGLTVMLLITAAVMVLNVRDGGVPGAIRGLDGAAMIVAIAAIVLAWLPANGRYASEQKAMR